MQEIKAKRQEAIEQMKMVGEHSCVVCPYKFKSMASMHSHIAVKHPEILEDLEERTKTLELLKDKSESFNCPECNDVFHDRWVLREHFEKQHPEQWAETT